MFREAGVIPDGAEERAKPGARHFRMAASTFNKEQEPTWALAIDTCKAFTQQARRSQSHGRYLAVLIFRLLTKGQRG